jgi:hypothetical protein
VDSSVFSAEDTASNGLYADFGESLVPKPYHSRLFDLNWNDRFKAVLKQHWPLISGVPVCLLPLILLFNLNSAFDRDWLNHLWAIEYSGAWLRAHGTLPLVYHTNQIVGLVLPLFYSGKFYNLAGLLSAWLGSALSIRLIVFAILLLQFFHVEHAVRLASASRLLAFSMATIVSWGIYPLTNLYNRSALPEYIAGLFLTASVASWFVLLLHLARGKKSYYDAIAAGLFYVCAALTHPLTAAFGGLFIFILSLRALVLLRSRWFVTVGLINGAAATLVLGSWIAVVFWFNHSLPVSNPHTNHAMFKRWGFFPGSIDNGWSRLSPLPLDLRATQHGLNVSTPYLDAQISIPTLLLLVLLLGLWWQTRGPKTRDRTLVIRLGTLALVLAGFCFLLSVHPGRPPWFLPFFDILQYPYRLVTYINLGLMTVLFSWATLVDWTEVERRPHLLAWRTAGFSVALTVATAALVVKLIHADAIRLNASALASIWGRPAHSRLFPEPESDWYPSSFGSAQRTFALPNTESGEFDFVVTRGMTAAPPLGFERQQWVSLPIDSESDFGSPKSLDLVLAQPALVVTNIQAFPWNRLSVDGSPIDSTQLVPVRSFNYIESDHAEFIAVPLTAGHHLLKYEFEPPRLWLTLNLVSWTAFGLWVFVWLAVLTFSIWRPVPRRLQVATARTAQQPPPVGP